MTTETTGGTAIPSQDEMRSLVERARRLRAETLARLLRTAWERIAHKGARRPAGAMPHAHA